MFYLPKILVTIMVWISLYCYVFSDAMEILVDQLKQEDYLDDEEFKEKSKMFYYWNISLYGLMAIYYSVKACAKSQRQFTYSC